MDDETKPIVQVFQHNKSTSTQTKPPEQSILNSNVSLKRRLEKERELTIPLKKLDNATLKRFEANASKSQASIYSMNGDRFIEEIMKRPGIWDSYNVNYKNKLKVKSLWEEIHRKFPNVSVDDLKKRWKNLKDAYRKELKRLQKQRSEGDLNAKPSWRYFDQLRFLKDSFKSISTECKDNETDAYGLEASSKSPILPGSEDEEEENGYYPVVSESDIKTELLRMERKKMWILEEEIAQRNQYMNSDNYHFLMSLLPEMNQLGPVQKMRLRTKISQAVLDEVSASICENEEVVKGDEQQPPPTFEEEIQEKTLEQEIKEEIIKMYD